MKHHNQHYRFIRTTFFALITSIFAFIAFFGSIYQFQTASASEPDLKVEIQAAYNLVVDSNVSSPSTYAPRVATVAGRFCNTTDDTTITNVYGYIGDFSEGTPGLYPATTDWVIDTRPYAFTHVGGAVGTADATRYVGDLAPGECKVQYWSFTYPACAHDAAGNPVEPPCTTTPTWGSSIKPDDDLSLSFDVWATADNGLTDNADWTMTTRNQISAMANKIKPNPDGQWFNTDTTTITPGSVITTNGVLYTLGNVRFGFDNDGDFVPDYNAWLQPFGDPSYDPSCFRLIRSSTVLTVSRSAGNPELIIQTNDQNIHPTYGGPLYFTNLPSDNNGVRGEVRYTFLALNGPCSLPISPYQEVASGFDNEKFNGDFGTGIPSVRSSAPEVTISKSGSPDSVAEGALIIYNIPFANQSETNSAGLTLSSSGINMPLVIRDSVPEGLAYEGGTADATLNYANNGVTIRYSTDGGATWSTTDPGNTLSAAPNTVVIEWWFNDPVPTQSDGVVTFQARVPVNYITEGGAPFITNEACANFGGAAAFACDTDVTMVEGENSIGDFVWADLNANGVQDEGPGSGIEGVTVWLYWDVNGDGVLDDDALLIAVTETDANGAYIFPDLPDGNYLVVVDSDSPNLPQGYANTTPAVHAVTGLSGSTSYTLADFGFGPVLSLIKRVVEDPGPPAIPPAYEGHPVTYEIELTNNLPGGPSDENGSCVYTFYADTAVTAGNANWRFTNPDNIIGAPNSTYAHATFSGGNRDWVHGLYDIENMGGTILKVEGLYTIATNGNLNAGEFIELFAKTGTIENNNPAAASFGGGLSVTTIPTSFTLVEWEIDDPAIRSWTTLTNPDLKLGVNLRKSGGAGSGTEFRVDAVGFRVTTNQLCGGQSSIIDPLPLTDTYDADKLEFVSASPLESSVSFTDTPYANTGIISWNNVGPLPAGQTKMVTVTFLGLEPAGNLTTEITNTATVTGATFSNGRPVNDAEDDEVISLEPTGSISGVVWNDNGPTNGVIDGGEQGIPGVTVYLYDNNDVLIATTITDANGDYTFGGLLPGSYYTVVDTNTLPGTLGDDLIQTGDPDVGGQCTGAECDNRSDLIPITAAAEDISNIDYGYTVPNTIYGHVWHDHNGDSNLDDATGIAGVTVRLFDNGTEIATTTTDANGRYIFTGMADGDYRVVIDSSTLPNAGDADVNWQQTYDEDVDLDDEHTIPVTIQGGNIFGAYDFGYYQGGDYSISGTVYADWNSNNTLDGEPGFEGITVTLYDEDGNVVAVTTTDANGEYTFGDLPPGTFTVVVNENDLPTQYSQTEEPENPGDPCTVCNGQGTVTLGGPPPGLGDPDPANFNFGYEPAGYGTIGDRVWRDNNGDGFQQAGEDGLENITVTLYADYGNGYVPVTTTVTGPNGIYSFGNLPPGDYRVEVDTTDLDLPLDGYGNPMVTTTPTFFDVALTSGQTYLDADFGFAPGGVIGNTIYWDANGNAEQDAAELGIPGVTVELWVWDADTGTWVFYDDAMTDADGEYLFTGLPRGDYQVRVDTSSGPIDGRTLTGDPDTNGIPCAPDPGDPWIDFCDSQHEVEIRPGQVYLGANFGYQPTGVIGDYIWLDSNGDGIQDPGEGPIAFVTVNLYELDGAAWVLSETTVTDSDGYYSFANLTAGTYRVEVDESTLPDGVSATYDRQNGTTDPGNNVYDIEIDASGVVTAIGGTACDDCNMEIDFGYQYVGTHYISGYIFDHPADANGDPIVRTDEGPRAQAGDLTYPDVTVYLWRQNDNGSYTRIAETVTGSNGFYEFGQLPPGNYAVSVDANDPALEGNSHVTHSGVYTGIDGIPNAENDGLVFEFVVIAGLGPGQGIEDIDFGFAGAGNPTAITLLSMAVTAPQQQTALPVTIVVLMTLLFGISFIAFRRRAA